MFRKAHTFALAILFSALPLLAQQSKTHNPTWWDKYQYILNNGPDSAAGATSSVPFGSNVDRFNDKLMITADANKNSPFRDNVYIAWDADAGGSASGGVRLARSTDHGAMFSVTRADDPSGPGRAIGAVPFVGPEGNLYVAWNDYAANTIAFTRSSDGGVSFLPQSVVANKSIPFDIAFPRNPSAGLASIPRATPPAPGCPGSLKMEEVFTASVK